MRDSRPNMALIAVLAVIATGLLAMFPSNANAHLDGPHFVVGSNGPQSDIDLSRFLSRLTTDRQVTMPMDLVNVPETEFITVFNTPTAGYTKRPVWYRAPFTVESTINDVGQSAFIEIKAAYLNDIRLTILSSETGETVWSDQVGDRIPSPPDRPASLKHIAKWPHLAPGHYWLTIRVQTNSAHVFEAHLQTEATVFAGTGSDSYRNGSYLGVLIVIFGLYLTFGLLSRDRAIIWYAVYILGLFLLNLGTSGYAHLLFKGMWPFASDLVTGSGTALSLGSAVAMWSYIIHLDRQNPILFRIMMSFAFLAIAGQVTAMSDYYIIYAQLFFIPDIFLLTTLLGYMILTGYRLYSPVVYLFYMFALGIPTVAGIVHLLTLLGGLPINSFTANAYQASSTIHLIMIAVAMGLRIYKLANKRADAFHTSARADQLAGEQRTFITMLSHEFRTPLAIIQRSAEILSLHLRDEKEAIHSRLSTIRTNAGQLSALVDAFLTKETLDSATFTTSRELIAIDQFLSDLIARRRREVQEHNVTLINSEFAIVDIDRMLLERAVVNLIENARKYAPGAAVWIACNRSANGYVYIRVVDEGPGIPPDDLNKVLNAFFRGRHAATTQGVGLGLHITNRIIEAHDGTMSISVGEKGGTTILLKLPYNYDATATRTNETLFGVMDTARPSPNGKGR
ncbi:MAG: sensor histidine kinase [Thalassospira sp.]|uniref:sensor histidine kinase n=1 Tax=Thalassospira sp. TaxID=1912094 RepID=UPI0032EDBB89